MNFLKECAQIFMVVHLSWVPAPTVAQSAAHIHIEAFPPAITEGATSYLKVNCTFGPLLGTEFDALSFLTLYYKPTSVQDANFREVALVSSANYRVETKENLGATTVTGLLNAAGISYIAFEWLQPKKDVSGRYMCEAQGLNSRAQPVTTMAMVKVSDAVTADYSHLLLKIEQLNATLLMQSGGDSGQINNWVNKLNNLTSQFNDQRRIIDTQSSQLANISAILDTKDAQIKNQNILISSLESRLQMVKNDCNNQSVQSDLMMKDFQTQLDTYGSRLDVDVAVHLDNLDNNVNQTMDQVNACITSQLKDHSQIVTQTERIDQLMSKMANQTCPCDAIVQRLDKYRGAVMQTATGFRGKHYFLSRPMWRNTAAFEGLCQLYGGHLVEVDDRSELDFLSDLIRGNNVTERVIIGGTDEGSEGNWRYQSSGRTMTYFNWATNFPSSSVRENCVLLEPVVGWQMENTYCSAKEWSRFVCEVTGQP